MNERSLQRLVCRALNERDKHVAAPAFETVWRRAADTHGKRRGCAPRLVALTAVPVALAAVVVGLVQFGETPAPRDDARLQDLFAGLESTVYWSGPTDEFLMRTDPDYLSELPRFSGPELLIETGVTEQ